MLKMKNDSSDCVKSSGIESGKHSTKLKILNQVVYFILGFSAFLHINTHEHK